jgi:hypothetical protein
MTHHITMRLFIDTHITHHRLLCSRIVTYGDGVLLDIFFRVGVFADGELIVESFELVLCRDHALAYDLETSAGNGLFRDKLVVIHGLVRTADGARLLGLHCLLLLDGLLAGCLGDTLGLGVRLLGLGHHSDGCLIALISVGLGHFGREVGGLDVRLRFSHLHLLDDVFRGGVFRVDGHFRGVVRVWYVWREQEV